MTKIIETRYIFIKSPQKYLTCLKTTKISPPPWLNIVPSLKKLSQAVLNEQNLQPKIYKREGDAGPSVYVTDCLQN